MEIINAQYMRDIIDDKNTAIQATINGQNVSVPLAPGNRHYDEIMRQVEAGELTIQDAE